MLLGRLELAIAVVSSPCSSWADADGTLDHLTRSRVQVVTVAVSDPRQACDLFREIPGVKTVALDGVPDNGFQVFRLEMDGEGHGDVGEPTAEIVRQQGWRLRELRRDDKSLEQVFRELTETGAEAAA